jgi:hypothetical protein
MTIKYYRKLKRTWSHGYANYIPNFREAFPELNKIDSEELCNRFIKLNLEFYCEEKMPVSLWIRFTLPFAILTIALMIAGSPIVFVITGKWGYPLSEKNILLNWFRSLRLL